MNNILQQSKLLNVVDGAKHLLGCVIVRTLEDGSTLKARIVETESYHQEDPASHTFGGITSRNSAMFGPAGYAYVYFSYGMHWCFNVTAGPDAYGAGILIRAAKPLEGIEVMKRNRSTTDIVTLCNGPAKLAQALYIDKSFYGHDLTKPPLQIFEPNSVNFKIKETTRIGISKGVDEIGRFYIQGSEFISRK